MKKYYRFRIDIFMEMFYEISGYERELYASKIAERTADYIATQYMDCSSEYWFTQFAYECCLVKMMEVFDLTEYDISRSFISEWKY